MVDDQTLRAWFCEEVLPLERSLMYFLSRHWRTHGDLIDFRQDVYEKVLAAAAEGGLPQNTKAYVFVAARNALINASRRQQVVSFELVADLEEVQQDHDMFATDRHMNARDELRRTQAALEALPARCREVVRLRKVEGYSAQEIADQLDVSISTVEKEITYGMRAITDQLLGGSYRARRPLQRLRRAKERRP
jgi:RNA polymerase sigma-70 factor (ECF subfamily)